MERTIRALELRVRELEQEKELVPVRLVPGGGGGGLDIPKVYALPAIPPVLRVVFLQTIDKTAFEGNPSVILEVANEADTVWYAHPLATRWHPWGGVLTGLAGAVGERSLI